MDICPEAYHQSHQIYNALLPTKLKLYDQGLFIIIGWQSDITQGYQ